MEIVKKRNITFNLELNAKQNKDGLHTIFIRVTEPRISKEGNSKMIRVKTEVNCKKDHFGKFKSEFNAKGEKIKKRVLDYGKWISKEDKESEFKNNQLERELQKYKKEYSEIKNKDKFVTGQHILNSLNTEEQIKDVVGFIDSKIKQTRGYNYQTTLISFKNKFVGYLEKSRAVLNIDFRHINKGFLLGFQNYLEKQKVSKYSKETMHQNTVYAYLNNLRTIFNDAIKEEMITPDVYPFKIFIMPKRLVIYKERLTLEEISKWKSVHYNINRNLKLFLAQQAFLLSLYCRGMRSGDLLSLKVKNIKTGRIEYNMRKGITKGKFMSIQIDDNIETILKYFITKKSKPNDFILPYMPFEASFLNNFDYDKLLRSKNTILDQFLKKVAEDAGINKNVSIHIARHSFSSILLKKKLSLKVVQDALGHSSPMVTQRYAGELDNDSLDEILKDIF